MIETENVHRLLLYLLVCKRYCQIICFIVRKKKKVDTCWSVQYLILCDFLFVRVCLGFSNMRCYSLQSDSHKATSQEDLTEVLKSFLRGKVNLCCKVVQRGWGVLPSAQDVNLSYFEYTYEQDCRNVILNVSLRLIFTFACIFLCTEDRVYM